MTVNRALCQCGMSCCLRHGSWSLPRGVCLPGQCCWCGGAAGVGPQSWKSRGLYLPLQLSLFSSSPDLYRHLHRPLVHKVLALVCPVRHLVVPGLGQAAAGRPAHPVLQTLGHLEVHEGLFPCLREYQALGRKVPLRPHLCGDRRSVEQKAGWEAEAWARPWKSIASLWLWDLGPIWLLMNE